MKKVFYRRVGWEYKIVNYVYIIPTCFPSSLRLTKTKWKHSTSRCLEKTFYVLFILHFLSSLETLFGAPQIAKHFVRIPRMRGRLNSFVRLIRQITIKLKEISTLKDYRSVWMMISSSGGDFFREKRNFESCVLEKNIKSWKLFSREVNWNLLRKHWQVRVSTCPVNVHSVMLDVAAAQLPKVQESGQR